MVVGPDVFNALKEHPQILDRFRYTSSESVTEAMLAKLFDLDEVVVGRATVFNDQTSAFDDIWGGALVLTYTPAAPEGFEEPSYGYTYTLKNHPIADAPYWDYIRRSWLYGVTYERKSVHTGIASGFLLREVL